jgi:hypothetical protein
MATPRLTPTAQGSNDLYWCFTDSKAVVVQGDVCPSCRRRRDRLNHYDGKWFDHDFLAHVHVGDDIKNEIVVVAETVKGVDDAEAEITVLREAIDNFTQQVHQGYHGPSGPDVCDVNHTECPRGICRSTQYLLSPRRKRGIK